MHAPSTFIMYISVYGGKLTWCLSETVSVVATQSALFEHSTAKFKCINSV